MAVISRAPTIIILSRIPLVSLSSPLTPLLALGYGLVVAVTTLAVSTFLIFVFVMSTVTLAALSLAVVRVAVASVVSITS